MSNKRQLVFLPAKIKGIIRVYDKTYSRFVKRVYLFQLYFLVFYDIYLFPSVLDPCAFASRSRLRLKSIWKTKVIEKRCCTCATISQISRIKVINIVWIINNRRRRRCKRIKEINKAIQVDLLIITVQLCHISVSCLSLSDKYRLLSTRRRRIPVFTCFPSRFVVNLKYSITSLEGKHCEFGLIN